MIEPSPYFWAYLAGFFDGEGHCSGLWSGIVWKLSQSGPEGKELLDRISSTFKVQCGLKGKLRVRRATGAASNLIKKPAVPRDYWELVVNHRDSVEYILHHILPFLHIKKVVAMDVLRYCKLYPRLTCGSLRRIDIQQCPKGHPYSTENTIWRKRMDGGTSRHCRICKREKDRRGHAVAKLRRRLGAG